MVRRVTTRRVRSVGLLVLIAGLALGGCSSSNREAGNLGTRVCIVNESTRTANVVFTKRDTARGEGSVAPGNQACGEGTFGTGNDVEGTITLASPRWEMGVQATNPWGLTPYLTLFANGRMCMQLTFKEGEKSFMDDGFLRYDVQRLADGQWKEWTVTVTESKRPSKNGLPYQCPSMV